MKYLLFDENAIAVYVSEKHLQSVEFLEGKRLVEHICGFGNSEMLFDTSIQHNKDGVLFVGKKRNVDTECDTDKHIFCFDLTSCDLLKRENNPTRLLTVVQRAFRLCLKVWNRYPFSASERISGTKSILFPFPIGDHNRLVIERSNQVQRLTSRGIVFPLLAYKYNAEDPGQTADVIRTDILRLAGEDYIANKYMLQRQLADHEVNDAANNEHTELTHVGATTLTEERNDFIFWDYARQLNALTDAQRKVVEYEPVDVPLRVDGAAGTGKTISLIMRAYRLLEKYRAQGVAFRIVFFAHNESTSLRNQEIFECYKDSDYYLNQNSNQRIQFTTLLSFCCEVAHVEKDAVIEKSAEDAKTYQLMLIDDAVKRAYDTNRVKTYRPIISPRISELFDERKTDRTTLVNMLQHEFSLQVKGRTNGTIEDYQELDSIANGIPCANNSDKELVFSVFMDYQKALQMQGVFDVDDVTIEAISHLNAPIWRRRRQSEGYDYIFVDEMHLFNLNEQSVFHHLSKDISMSNIPICFALDYSQAIGDRGNISRDYISSGALGKVKQERFCTIFRNSPPIVDFCATIAASGTLMFGASFSNPYKDMQYNFTHAEEQKMQIPKLHMYANDDAMLADLHTQLMELMKSLQCKPREIAVIAFDEKWLSNDGLRLLEEKTEKTFSILGRMESYPQDNFILTSPYDVNGLEFQAVILLGVDEGRVPQTIGTSDVSRHFIMYSAYNMLYLCASRAKYRVVVMGMELRGVSSCLNHSITAKTIEVEKHPEIVITQGI